MVAKSLCASATLTVLPALTRGSHTVRTIRPPGRITSIFTLRAMRGSEVTRAVITMRATLARNAYCSPPRALERAPSFAHPSLADSRGGTSMGEVRP